MNETSSRSLGRTVLAALILLVAAWVLLHFVIHIVVWVASVAAVIVAIVALIWALRVLL
jgi:sugar phosphate permease